MRNLLVFSLALSIAVGASADWRQFKGDDTTGVANDYHPPTDVASDSAIAWTGKLPGRGLASPIVVGDQVFITASSGVNQDRLHVISFDTKTGAKRWERQFWATGRTMCHEKSSVAAPTPASDGERIYALYSSNDLVCLDLAGNLVWMRALGLDYPNASNSLGMASSPVVVGNTLVVPSENDSESFAAGLDRMTGINLWKKDRPKKANWTTPVSVVRVGKPAVVLQSGHDLVAVEPTSGEELWKSDTGYSTIPSPAVEGGKIFAPGNGIIAFDIASNESKELWRSNKLNSSTASPIAWKGKIYAINNASVLNCAKQESGENVWQLRIKGPFSGSPIIAGGHLYIVSEKGILQVVKLGDSAGTLASERNLDDTFLSTPAATESALYVRSDTKLIKLGK